MNKEVLSYVGPRGTEDDYYCTLCHTRLSSVSVSGWRDERIIEQGVIQDFEVERGNKKKMLLKKKGQLLFNTRL